jgi:hypothetical protein
VPRSSRHRKRGAVLAVAALAVAVVAIAAVLGPWSRSNGERIRDLVDWPDSCAEVEVRSPLESGEGAAWSRATETAGVTCHKAGPFVRYARYERTAALRADLLQHPPGAATCIARDEVVVDGLDEGQFPALCRELAGDVVDGVADIPRPGGRTIASIEASVARYERRATAAQRRALARYWRDRER